MRPLCRSMANSLALYISSKSKRATEGLIQNVGRRQLSCGEAKQRRSHSQCGSLLPALPTPPCWAAGRCWLTLASPSLASSAAPQPSELTAGKGSKPTVIAGAISNRAREGGCPNITGQSPGICSQAAAAALARRCVTSPGTLLPLPSKQAASGVSGLPCVARSQRVPPALPPGIGPEAVCNAIMAVCHARLYLEQDHLDVRVVPSFQVRGRVLSVGAGAVAVVCGGEGG
jgi:stage V sporulation protein SpoVS